VLIKDVQPSGLLQEAVSYKAQYKLD